MEKLSQKNEAKAEHLIDQVEQMPIGEKLIKKTVDRALSEEGGRRKKREEITPVAAALDNAVGIPSSSEVPADSSINRNWINPGKVKRVARILGLPDGDEAEVLTRLIDEFLALRDEGTPPF